MEIMEKEQSINISKFLPIVPYDPLARYIQEIKKYPLLNREEEHDLAVRFRIYKDKKAAFILITSNLLLVVKLVMEFRTQRQNLLDLIQEGNIGLLEAINRFDPYRNVRFSTYASWWIKAYVLKYILDNWRIVKFGTTNKKRRLFYNLKKEKARLESMGISPGLNLLAERLSVAEGDIIEMTQNIKKGDISLESTIDNDKDIPLIDLLADKNISPEEKTGNEEFQYLINQKISKFKERLSERERVILTDRLLAEKPATLQEIADRFNKTKEAIRYTENKILGRLKEFLSKEIPDLQLNLLSNQL